MKKLILAAVVTALASFPSVMTAQSPSSTNPQHRVLGYQDPETGKFHPLAKIQPDTTPPSHGTIRLSISILIRSTFPSTANFLCGAMISASSINLTTDAQASFGEEAYSPATVSGSTATCTVTIPYSWAIPAASSTVDDSITGSYSVTVVNSDGTVSGSVLRVTSGDFLSLTTVPASDTTTSVSESLIM